MNMDQVLAPFAFAANKTLHVTMATPEGRTWVEDSKALPPRPAPAYSPDKDSCPVVRIELDSEWPWLYTDFPVENLASQDGQLVLSGPKGTATFRVVE